VTEAVEAARAHPAREPAPAAVHLGGGHRIMHGTPAFVARYGAASIGQPAREAMIDLPAAAFELFDRVLAEGRPLARRIVLPDGERRLVVVPRHDPGSDEVYGVTTWLREPPA
jgi:hypothetical protein